MTMVSVGDHVEIVAGDFAGNTGVIDEIYKFTPEMVRFYVVIDGQPDVKASVEVGEFRLIDDGGTPVPGFGINRHMLALYTSELVGDVMAKTLSPPDESEDQGFLDFEEMDITEVFDWAVSEVENTINDCVKIHLRLNRAKRVIAQLVGAPKVEDDKE